MCALLSALRHSSTGQGTNLAAMLMQTLAFEWDWK